MPFKLKLKKSRHYNVMSKSLFVISVVILDSSTKIDCTLNSESTGQECLENVCQRISIGQPEFFGLKYILKGTKDELRWVDLERPLNRQLEKYSANTKVLYLRVMYYVLSGVSLIKDEVTRNYYFLQLKHDVVEGRINCDPKQAVILANYSRQAEYGNHQERHTVEYLKTLLSFPMHLIKAGLLETLTEEVIHQHYELHNVTQGDAESLYISACQQLDGYGQETFTAKTENGNEVMLGISVSGIIVASESNNKFYPWRDIRNVVNHKRAFNIECTSPNESVGFVVEDAVTGRYIWKLCALQHTFFVKYEQNQMHTNEININLFQSINENLNDSREDLLSEQQYYQHPISSQAWQQSDTHLSTTGGMSEQQLMSSNTNIAVNSSSNNIQSMTSLHTAASIQMNNFSTHSSYLGLNPASSNLSLINRAQSSSCLDLSNNNLSYERERLKALLPTYRPAPDYETAIQRKYGTSANDVRQMNGNAVQHLSASQVLPHEPSHNIDYISGSQPDVSFFSHGHIQRKQTQQRYPDVTQNTAHIIGPHYSDASDYGLTQRFKMMRLVKPPPPYPANRLSSTSTPDLASHRAILAYRGSQQSDIQSYSRYKHNNSSPDLVSSRQLVSHHQTIPQNNSIIYPAQQMRHSQNIVTHGTRPGLHGTYENLNFIEPSATSAIMPKHLYYMPEHLMISSNHIKAKHSSTQHINGSIEPIYENVPLPLDFSAESETIVTDNAIIQTETITTTDYIDNQEQSQLQQPQQQIIASFSEEMSIISQNSDIHSNLSTDIQPNTSQPIQTILPTNNTMASNINKIEDTKNKNLNVILNDSLKSKDTTDRTNIFDVSQISNFTIGTNTTNDSGISTATGSSVPVKEKRRKIWDILGGKSKNSDKQKTSYTLGREKDKKNKNASGSSSLNKSDFKHRWSTGLPKLQPLPANISKEKLSQLLETKLADTELFYEFERIPKRCENATYNCALHDENKSKNFDNNFLPYDNNRVRLLPTKDNKIGYVNASYITTTVGSRQKFYIIAESPNNSVTTNIFWQCVWEADVYFLVQLSSELNYIPQTSERCLEYGQYQVWKEFSQETERCTTSKLRIYHMQSRRYRSVWHLSYNEWAEQNVPKDVGHFLEFLEELNSVRLASVAEVPPSHNTNPPVLMHCSEAGGRTGVTLVADLLLYTIDHNQDLDIPRLIGQLRQQRDNLIPSLAQYKFIHALLIHYLKQTRLI